MKPNTQALPKHDMIEPRKLSKWDRELVYKGHEFEIIKYRHEDQVRSLKFMSEYDFKYISGYFSIQILFGAFISTKDLSWVAKYGFIMLDLSITFICLMLLLDNFKRRKEVSATLRNCNVALGLKEKGDILPDRAIDAQFEPRSWFIWYVGAIALCWIAVTIIIIGAFATYPVK